MLFSIIIPSYNRGELLRKTLDSVWTQTYTDFEVIVVDDGSTDHTGTILQTFGNRLRYSRTENIGPGLARNVGAHMAGGDYLAFLDSDDLWFPWTLSTFAQLISEHDSPAILSAQITYFTNESETSAIRYQPIRFASFPDYIAASHESYFLGAGMAVLKRQPFLESGGFTHHPINCEDHDLILRLGTTPGFVQILQPITLACRKHSGNISSITQLNVSGTLHLISEEKVGSYPGGVGRQCERREIITRHSRPVALACLRQRMTNEAWAVFTATLPWHLRLRRWKFLLGFLCKYLLQRCLWK